MDPEMQTGIAKSIDPYQTAPLETVWSGFVPFAKTL